MRATRRTAREWAIQMLTAADLNPPDNRQEFMDSYWKQVSELGADGWMVDQTGSKNFAELRSFAEKRVAGVLDSKDELDKEIVAYLDNWDIFRLGTVERSVLRMGIWEMRNTDIPKPVIINEAVDLVNWFSSPRGRTLVNGVLDRYAKSLE